MGVNPVPELDEGEETRCARHPNVVTGLRCGRCNTPICPRCLVQTPVGARCPDCANVRRLPTVDVSPIYLARGIAAAAVSGAVVGVAWGWAISGTRGIAGIFLIFIAMIIGYAIAEAIAAATNRKRSVTLQACAVGGVALAYIVHNLVLGVSPLPAGDVWGYLATGFAAFVAVQRLQA